MNNNSTQITKERKQATELVLSFERSEEVAQQIIEASRNGEAVIGVDCEGILRGRPLCLIQVSFIFKVTLSLFYRFTSKVLLMCSTYLSSTLSEASCEM